MIEVKFIEHMGSDLSVVNSARVSFDKHHEEFVDGSDDKLIRYLAKHKHTSPFGHAFASFRVSAPVFVRAQLVKHKFLRVNEVSRRYVNSDPRIFSPDYWREVSKDKKQGSGDNITDAQKRLQIESKYSGAALTAVQSYKQLLDMGVCEEQARMVLPQAMITEWYWSGSLDAWADMCNLRCKPDAQYESQLVATQIDEKMKELFPVSWGALRS